jgi:cell fate regulator YaaT (PSP1 superfamily)
MLRLATPEDLLQEEQNRALEKRAWEHCLRRVQTHRLPIYLVQVDCLFDASKIIFYFTAPGRVDFRELVKDLVQEFRIRIELRQIGVRHRAKMVGGLGICGRGLCCASFLRDFEPVSVRMAKEQQLSLNPNKISGICGRLMCCLTYEYAAYQDVRKHLPRVGKRIQTPAGEGKIIRYNLIRETVTLELEDKQELEVALADLNAGDTPANSN